MTPTEVLTAARDLIADPDHWCQGAAARTSTGDLTTARNRRAVAWCGSGAIRVTEPDGPVRYLAEMAVANAMGSSLTSEVSAFNDSHTHGEVLAAFDRAIETTT